MNKLSEGAIRAIKFGCDGHEIDYNSLSIGKVYDIVKDCIILHDAAPNFDGLTKEVINELRELSNQLEIFVSKMRAIEL